MAGTETKRQTSEEHDGFSDCRCILYGTDEAEPFVRVGDRVEVGQVIGIVEAVKHE
ncbi:MAG: hypothetical protein ACLSFZ_02560 [Frisingicoccus sp.]